jgi:hypothetical protein
MRYEPDARLQAQFASLPPLHCPRSIAAGLRHDGTVEALVRRVLDPVRRRLSAAASFLHPVQRGIAVGGAELQHHQAVGAHDVQ